MKSIMQEASSVIKAIEKGWENAGKPKEFSIKVFEEPKKNFIGITVQSAKVGIFFDEKLGLPKDIEKEKPFVKKVEQPQQRPQQQRKESFVKTEKPEQKDFRKEIRKIEPTFPKQEVKEPLKVQKIVWTPEMITLANQWLSDVLKASNLGSVGFTIQASHYQLLINFNKQLLMHEDKEQQLLRCFSLLLIQTLRHALKRPLRGFKIIMTRGL